VKKINLALTLIITSLLLSGNIIAKNQQDQSFDDIDRMLDQQFKQKSLEIDSLYNAYTDAINDAFNGVTKKIEVKWPSNVKLPTKSTWVGYSKNLQTRSIVDYQAGELVIETVVTNNDLSRAKQDLEVMAAQLTAPTTSSIEELDIFSQAVNESLTKKGIKPATKPLKNENTLKKLLPKNNLLKIATVEINQLKEIKEPTLIGSIKRKESLPAIVKTSTVVSPVKIDKSPQNIEPNLATTPAKEISSVIGAEQAKVTVPTIMTAPTLVTAPILVPVPVPVPAIITTPATKLASNSPNQKATTEPLEADIATKEPVIKLDLVETAEGSLLKMTVKFVNNYQKVLLANNFDDVKKFSKKYDVAISVILAIIETESSYNPRAISRVPAFGLMQLVPKTAGIDAHNYVHGQKKILSPDYLFDETNNLQLGTAYFKLLKSRYLRKIKDSQSRFYCAVSSYNTGVGNLAKTFTGKKNLSKAAKVINTMTADEVYQYLLKNLPAEETRNYLKKIVKRRAKYVHFDSEIKEI